MTYFVSIGEVHVRPDEVVAIRKGEWSPRSQDWLAILVMGAGAEIFTSVCINDALAILNREKRLADNTSPEQK